jgi:hypothetical protein
MERGGQDKWNPTKKRKHNKTVLYAADQVLTAKSQDELQMAVH